MQKIAQSWQDILAHWGESNDMIAELTLKAIGKWVSWIDISLVVNQRMLELLFQQLARAQRLNLRPHEEKARDAAIDVFTEITGKKMKTSDKLEMISFLDLDRVVTQLIACPPLSERRGSSQYDTDLAETVAKLVNVTVLEIVRALETESGNLRMWQEQRPCSRRSCLMCYVSSLMSMMRFARRSFRPSTMSFLSYANLPRMGHHLHNEQSCFFHPKSRLRQNAI